MPAPTTLEPILAAKNLVKEYALKRVVNNVSLELYPGEVLGFLGPNGAGKTTTVNMLFGLVRPTAGQITANGIDVLTNSTAARRFIGVVTQDDNLDTDLTALENLVHYAHLHGITGPEAKAKSLALMKRVGIEEYVNFMPEQLSGGLKRRLALTRALIHDPKIVFLDEPTTGLDPQSRQDFWKLVVDLRASGRAVILTSHYMDEAERLSDRLILIQKGEIVRDGRPKELIKELAGNEVAELEGISVEVVKKFADASGTWFHPVGDSFAVGLGSDEKLNQRWKELQELGASRVSRRRGNLDDVFIRLTGGSSQR